MAVTYELGIGQGVLPAGAHVGYWYRTPAEKIQTLLDYFAAGLKAGQLCLCVLPGDDVEAFLEAAEPKLGEALKAGRLRMAPAEEFFFKNRRFHPNRLIKTYPDLVRRASADGFHSIRAAGEMPWRLLAQLSMPSFFEYEERVNSDFFGRYSAIGLCMFDMERYGVEWTLGILRTHPQMLSHGSLFDNPSYSKP